MASDSKYASPRVTAAALGPWFPPQRRTWTLLRGASPLFLRGLRDVRASLLFLPQTDGYLSGYQAISVAFLVLKTKPPKSEKDVCRPSRLHHERAFPALMM